MDFLTDADFEALIEKRAECCLSVYLPTHRALPEARQDPIRFKNLLREAESGLASRGLRAPEIEDLLKPARDLLDDPLFWRYQATGLAVFLSRERCREYRLPISFPELLVVSDRFHIKPLLPLLSSDDRFFILALSLNNVRLIEGTLYGAGEIELQNVPGSLKEILRGYDFDEQLQFHTRAQQAGAERAAVFHGHGSGTEDIKPRISEYFRQIDEGVLARLRNQNAPLVLAGVESLFPLYRGVNSYPGLLEEGIAGNPESLSAEELRQRAWEIVEPRFVRERQDANDHYQDLVGTGRTSSDLQEVVTAAHDGRIEVLFVAIGVQIWGSFDDESRSVLVHEQQAEAGDLDLLDLCAVRTLLNRGTVYAVAPEIVPDLGPVAAVFRY